MEPMELRSRTLNPTSNGSETLTEGNLSPKKYNLQQMKRRKIISPFFLGRIIIWGLFGIYVVIPLLVHYSPTIQTNIIFLSFVKWPLFVDYTNPDACGLQHAYNFYLESPDGIKLGVWHTLPSSVNVLPNFKSEEEKREFFENSLHNGLPVVLYAHGNAGTRAGPHRVQLYKVFRDLNYHVIAFDYRGYADSSKVNPTEEGVVNDAKFMYNWLRRKIPAKFILIWGHSLGTGVSTQMVKKLCDDGDLPLGLVLEAPFNNLRDEIRNHPLTLIYRYMPFFDKIFLDGIQKSLVFASDRYIETITIPILILHAEDDTVIPIELGQQLYNAAVSSRSSQSNTVSFYKFDGVHGYGHKHICNAPELPSVVKTFVDKCQSLLTQGNVRLDNANE